MNESKPQVLLKHYLKRLKLPTILREYQAMPAACLHEGTCDYGIKLGKVVFDGAPTDSYVGVRPILRPRRGLHELTPYAPVILSHGVSAFHIGHRDLFVG